MILYRKQNAGNINFLVSSHFDNEKGVYVKELLSRVMLEKAKKLSKDENKTKSTEKI